MTTVLPVASSSSGSEKTPSVMGAAAPAGKGKFAGLVAQVTGEGETAPTETAKPEAKKPGKKPVQDIEIPSGKIRSSDEKTSSSAAPIVAQLFVAASPIQGFSEEGATALQVQGNAEKVPTVSASPAKSSQATGDPAPLATTNTSPKAADRPVSDVEDTPDAVLLPDAVATPDASAMPAPIPRPEDVTCSSGLPDGRQSTNSREFPPPQDSGADQVPFANVPAGKLQSQPTEVKEFAQKEPDQKIVVSYSHGPTHPTTTPLADVLQKTEVTIPPDAERVDQTDRSHKSVSPKPDDGRAASPETAANGNVADPVKSHPEVSTRNCDWATIASPVHPANTSTEDDAPAFPSAREISIHGNLTAQDGPVAKEAPALKVKPVEDEAKTGPSSVATAIPALETSPKLQAPHTAADQAVPTLPSKAVDSQASHPASDSKPLPGGPADSTLSAAAPGIQTARLTALAGGQAEMHIGLRTSAFGTVEVHAVVRDSQVGLVIGAERGELHRLLGNEVSGISDRLGQQNFRLDSVKFFEQGLSFDAGSGSGADPRSRALPPPRTVAPDLARTREPADVPVDFGNPIESRPGLNVRA